MPTMKLENLHVIRSLSKTVKSLQNFHPRPVDNPFYEPETPPKTPPFPRAQYSAEPDPKTSIKRNLHTQSTKAYYGEAYPSWVKKK